MFLLCFLRQKLLQVSLQNFCYTFSATSKAILNLGIKKDWVSCHMVYYSRINIFDLLIASLNISADNYCGNDIGYRNCIFIFKQPPYRRYPFILALFVRLPVRSFATQNFRNSSSVFFWFFCMTLQSDKVQKVMEPNYKKVRTWYASPESLKNAPKMRFWGFRQKFNLFMCTFLTWIWMCQ